ncbi:MAG: flagellar motor switch protein FliN [Fimbriimonadales bacterium]|nr:flagellar motor switch protein FliN [Fimbriimonadales bacterium]
MSNIPVETVTKFTTLQNQIWQTASLTVSEAANLAVNFSSPLVVPTKVSDLYSEIGAPMLVIQFALASLPENSTVVLLSQETVAGLASLIKGETVSEIDESLVSEMRPMFEGLVQGICMAIGNSKNEAVVASGLSVRYQIFSFPPNMLKADELLRIQVAVSSEEETGTAIWLVDSDTAHHILGLEMPHDEPEPAAFGNLQAAVASSQPSSPTTRASDPGSLELLLDIPLEISVELGRVKMLVKEVVELGTGSIIEIDKAAGEPVDVLVNGRLVARGEVVVIEDNFGVRITEILTPQERLTKLGEVA